MAIHHAWHHELAGCIEYLDIAAPRGNGRCWANSHDPVVLDAHNPVTDHLTVYRIKHRPADDLERGHERLLLQLPFKQATQYWYTHGNRGGSRTAPTTSLGSYCSGIGLPVQDCPARAFHGVSACRYDAGRVLESVQV